MGGKARSKDRFRVLVGLFGLIVGALVYIVDRPPSQTYFVCFNNFNISLHNIFPNIFGPIGAYLPDFLHVFSFILITAGIVSIQRNRYVVLCLGWVIIEWALELGQEFKTIAMRLTPAWFEGIPYLENTRNFFYYGTFCVFDLVAITLGAIAAFVLLVTIDKKYNYDDRSTSLTYRLPPHNSKGIYHHHRYRGLRLKRHL